MHAIEGSGNVPAFLTKLWRLVDDVQTNDLISWTQNGRSFIIRNQAKFARELLPQYYKHNNMASFVRQLNMYGFHKVVSADSGGLRLERDEMEFAHPHFLRGQEELIENIKRKQQRRLASDGMDFSQIPSSRTVVLEENKNVNKLLTDVRDMKRDQDTMSSKLLNLKRENEALWREYANMRQKFSKQQQIIEKLIHFLIAMVKSPSKTLGPKRKFGHLALESGDDITSAAAKLTNLSQLTQGASVEMGGPGGTGGAQIQEVTDTMEEPVIFTIPEATHTMASQEPFETVVEGLEPETILLTRTDANANANNIVPFTNQTMPTVVSPGGTSLNIDDNPTVDVDFDNVLLQDSPLSPELLNTVDPSAVTPSFKYASPAPLVGSLNAPLVSSGSLNTPTSLLSSSLLSSPATTSILNASSATPLLTTSTGSNGMVTSGSKKVGTKKITVLPQKGKAKTKGSPKAKVAPKASMSVAVPDKTFKKNSKGPATKGADFQSHVDDMQTNIDSLQEMLGAGTLNVDPSMLISMFSNEDSYLPELDSMVTTNGNELSVYNPSLLDLAGDIEEEADPFSFLNPATSSADLATPSSSSYSPSSFKPSSSYTPSSSSFKSSSGPTPPKHLRLNIKTERDDVDDLGLDTPQVSPPSSSKPLFRGKKRGN